MRILVVTLLYTPDGGPSAPLFGMLCENLANLGHEISVIAAVPHYPTGQVPPEYRRGWIQRSQENGVNVIRVRIPSVNRSRFLMRSLQFLAYQVGATWAGLCEQYDVVLVTNPAIESGLPFAVLATLRRKPSIFSVHDVYPDVGVQLGIFQNRFVTGLVEIAERFCLVHANYVRILSESFRPAMHRMGVADERIELIYDWTDTDFIRPVSRDNAFAREYDLVDKFVILYAGNIGLSQGLDQVLVAAQKLADYEHLRFVFVGDGAGRETLMKQAEDLKLNNVKFIPFQPRPRVPEVLGTADLALVSLQPEVGSGSLPSKTFSYLASQRPIIAVIDEGSDTWQLIERARAGVCLPHGDPDRFAQLVLELEADPLRRETMGKSGRAYAEEHHSSQKAAQRFAKLLERSINYG